MADTREQSSAATTQPGGLLPGQTAEGSETYRPLSLLAIAAIALAGAFAGLVVLGGLADFARDHLRWLLFLMFLALLFAPLRALFTGKWRTGQVMFTSAVALGLLATVLGLGGLVAYSSRTYWNWPGTLWPLPVAALICAWLAKQRIKAAEDTLGGGELARWGIRLTVFYGLCYLAYMASTTFAVRSQARDCAENFLEQIRGGYLHAAFVETLKPRSRPEKDNLRLAVEIIQNVPRGPAEPGPFTVFLYTPYVPLLAMSGEQANWELTNVDSSFSRGGCQVSMLYKVSTPYSRFELIVTANGEEEQSGAVRRRLWHIDLNNTYAPKETQQQTDLGKQLLAVHQSTQDLVLSWTNLVFKHELDAAFLDTLEPAKRRARLVRVAREAPALVGLTGVAIFGGLGVDLENRMALEKEREAFRHGGIVDKERFICSPAFSKEMHAELDSLFSPSPTQFVEFGLAPRAEMPYFEIKGDEVVITVAVRMASGIPGQTRYQYEGGLVLQGPLVSKPVPSSAYRVVRLRWLRGMTAPKPPAMKPPREG